MLQLRDKNYFNENDLYLFEGINMFLSKVEVSEKAVYTIQHPKRMQYKATTLRCVNISELN